MGGPNPRSRRGLPGKVAWRDDSLETRGEHRGVSLVQDVASAVLDECHYRGVCLDDSSAGWAAFPDWAGHSAVMELVAMGLVEHSGEWWDRKEDQGERWGLVSWTDWGAWSVDRSSETRVTDDSSMVPDRRTVGTRPAAPCWETDGWTTAKVD